MKKAKAKTKKTSPKKRKFSIKKKRTICDDMESVIKKINKVQTEDKKINLIVSLTDSAVVENILKDAEITFQKKERKQTVLFKISYEKKGNPGEYAFGVLEEIDDEIQY